MSVFLGIDIGTSGTKTLAIDAEGQILASALETYPLYQPKPLWSEQDPEDWWKATIGTVRRVVKTARLKPADVKAIGLSGQMHGSVFLDKQGKVVRRAILWNDQRTAAECEEIERRAGGRSAVDPHGRQPGPDRLHRAQDPLAAKPRAEAFREDQEGPAAQGRDPPPLDGRVRHRSQRRQRHAAPGRGPTHWSADLLSKLELDSSLLARCYESEEVTGRLTPAVAAELGLSTDCLVVGGAGDCAAGAVGNGIVTKGVLSTSLGTSGVVFVHSDEVKIDPEGRVHTFCHAVRGKWHMMGVNLSAGGSLQWFRNALCEATVAEAKKKKVDVYTLLTAEAETVPAGSSGLFFLPYLSGERTPHADPDARGCFIGLTLSHQRAHLIRAILEGVTYSMRDSLAIFEDLGVPIRQIRASGGGARSALWRQIQADAFGRKVVTINTEEGPAYGVALLAAVGAGEYKNIAEACAATIRVVSETAPNKAAKKVYDAAFPLYQQLYQSLKGDFKAIAGLD